MSKAKYLLRTSQVLEPCLVYHTCAEDPGTNFYLDVTSIVVVDLKFTPRLWRSVVGCAQIDSDLLHNSSLYLYFTLRKGAGGAAGLVALLIWWCRSRAPAGIAHCCSVYNPTPQLDHPVFCYRTRRVLGQHTSRSHHITRKRFACCETESQNHQTKGGKIP